MKSIAFIVYMEKIFTSEKNAPNFVILHKLTHVLDFKKHNHKYVRDIHTGYFFPIINNNASRNIQILKNKYPIKKGEPLCMISCFAATGLIVGGPLGSIAGVSIGSVLHGLLKD